MVQAQLLCGGCRQMKVFLGCLHLDKIFLVIKWELSNKGSQMRQPGPEGVHNGYPKE